jgi:cephalosporin-C deacetylase-like acetyl esterase
VVEEEVVEIEIHRPAYQTNTTCSQKIAAMDHERYSDFTVHETVYKVVNEQPINTYVLIPKAASSTPRPVIVKFHGGFLVSSPPASTQSDPVLLMTRL